MRNKDKGGWWGLAVFLVGCTIMAIHALLDDED